MPFYETEVFHKPSTIRTRLTIGNVTPLKNIENSTVPRPKF